MITCGNCKLQHIDKGAVKACFASGAKASDFATQRAAAIPAEPVATPKQVAFITKLRGERGQDVTAEMPTTKAAASTLINALLAMPKVEGADTIATDLEDGMYAKHGTFFKVYTTKHGSNQKVAKRLVIDGQDTDGKYRVHFEYEGKKGLKGITADMKLTAEEAKQFGLLYGVCVRCGLDLTKEESIYVGYGRTCAGHEGWWYPTTKQFKALLTQAEDNGDAVAEALAAGF